MWRCTCYKEAIPTGLSCTNVCMQVRLYSKEREC